MISCRLFGDVDVYNQQIYLPAIPRVGDTLSVPKCSNHTYRVMSIRFEANEDNVTLFLEWNI